MSLAVSEKANLYTFDAGYIESMLAQGNWNACWEYMGGLIENLTITASTTALLMGIQLQKEMQDETTKKYVNDFGALLGELFMFLLTNDSVGMSDASFEKLIYYHETLHTLFYIYNIDDTDDAVQTMLSGNKRLSGIQQKKLLLLLSLDTKLDIENIFRSIDQKYRVSGIVSFLSERKIFRERVYNNKIRLYALRREIDKSHTNISCFAYTTNVFFKCSYMNHPDKHKIKENVNAAFRNHIMASSRDYRRLKNIPSDKSNLNIDPAKPTILVMAELFARNHAMYRCYGNRVKAMRSEFNVVFLMPAEKVDYSLREDFENFIVFNNLTEFYKVFHDVTPDIVFMPSVGMTPYTIFAANMRHAPIQIMSLGHPATTLSDQIDYVIGPSDLYDEKAFPTDVYIGDGPARAFLPLLSKEKFFEDLPENSGPKTVIKIAVIGTDIKVSYPFFRLLKEIVEQSHFEIHVSFLMAVGGIDSLYIEKYLKENFKNSTYYGWQNYEDYIQTMKSVDIVLNPFPFGHTNTIIDTLMCGKPCVGLEGFEPASKTEAHVLRSADLEDQFVAKDEDDYKNKFFGIAERILNGDTVFYDREVVYDKIFKHTADEDYGRVIKWIYDNHSRLKASKKKYLEIFEEV